MLSDRRSDFTAFWETKLFSRLKEESETLNLPYETSTRSQFTFTNGQKLKNLKQMSDMFLSSPKF